MDKNVAKPSPEAKALSLFLMAYQAKDPFYKEQLKRINRQWDLTKKEKISKSDYQKEVEKMLQSYGGYDQVVEKTIRFYIETTGRWNISGDDKYSLDAKEIAEKIKKK